MKEMVIPPITKNPRLGKETERDASVMYGGAQLPKKKRERTTGKKPVRRRKQRTFSIKNEPQLKQLMEVLNLDATAVVNLALARLAHEYR